MSSPRVVSKLLLSPREKIRNAIAAYISSHVSSAFEPEAVGQRCFQCNSGMTALGVTSHSLMNMGSAPLERMLVFHFKPAQKLATREVMGSRNGCYCLAQFTCYGYHIPSQGLYSCPKISGAADFREAAFCIRWWYCSQGDETLTVEDSAKSRTSMPLLPRLRDHPRGRGGRTSEP